MHYPKSLEISLNPSNQPCQKIEDLLKVDHSNFKNCFHHHQDWLLSAKYTASRNKLPGGEVSIKHFAFWVDGSETVSGNTNECDHPKRYPADPILRSIWDASRSRPDSQERESSSEPLPSITSMASIPPHRLRLCELSSVVSPRQEAVQAQHF